MTTPDAKAVEAAIALVEREIAASIDPDPEGIAAAIALITAARAYLDAQKTEACPNCGNATYERVYTVCAHCGDDFVTAEQMKRNEAGVKNASSKKTP